MTLGHLVRRSLRHYWPTNLAVVLGVAIAVSVLGGALVVGESVQASLRRIALDRLGRIDAAVLGQPFVREALADDIATRPGFRRRWRSCAPILVFEGVIEHAKSRRRAGRVTVLGADDRFYRALGHDDGRAPLGRDAVLSRSLGAEIGATPGDALVLTLEQPSAIPAGALQGRREGNARAVRLTAREGPARGSPAEFSMRPHQGSVRGVVVPLALLQRALASEGRVNAVLVAGGEQDERPADHGEQPAGHLAAVVREAFTLEDVGIRVRTTAPADAVVVENESGYLSEPLERAAIGVAAADGDVEAVPVLTYLADTIRTDGREIPYSVVSALDLDAYGAPQSRAARPSPPASAGSPPLWLNEWAFRDLQAQPGAAVTLEYYVWSDEEGLLTRSADFTLAGTIPMAGAGGDRSLTPEYPGLTDELRMSDWDPPFPIDLRRVRPVDERYWDEYRAAPKAFASLEDGQRLWASRYGRVTSVRLVPRDGADPGDVAARVRARLRSSVDPIAAGALSVVPLRDDAIRASTGTTDFGEYFVYFSFFLVVSGLLLAGLFFRLGIEQRLRELGLLRAVGYPEAVIRRLFLTEGVLLAAAGAGLGAAGAVGYAALIMHALRTWWTAAVGTTDLVLDPRPTPVLLGAAAGVVLAPLVIAFTLRRLVLTSPRALIAGGVGQPDPDDASGASQGRFSRQATVATLLVASAVVLLALSAFGAVGRVIAFFAAGSLLLAAGLSAVAARLRAPAGGTIGSRDGRLAVPRLGARGASYRPGRTMLSIALIALATFTIVSVGAFRRGTPASFGDPGSGTGGYALLAESVSSIHYDFGSPEGRSRLGFAAADASALDGVSVARLRLRAGDDASCLNLYRPTRPRILGMPREVVAQDRFAFGASLADTPQERGNPWLLLDRRFDDGAVPAIGDANSLTYVFHLGIGDDFALERPGTSPIRLRIVAALSDSVFQSELIVSEEQFRKLFPDEGFRAFLIDPGPRSTAEVARVLEDGLADHGLDVTSTADRLATFHQVENTYLTTFQTLGGLGLLLGTLGVGVVLFRNVLERRREFAVLRAVGFGDREVTLLVISESALLVAVGVGVGALAALVAVAPAIAERASAVPIAWLAALVGSVVATGLLSSVVAAAAARRLPVVAALRTE